MPLSLYTSVLYECTLNTKQKFLFGLKYCAPIPVAAQSKAYVFDRSPAEILGSNPTHGMDFVCCECCVLSGRGFCAGLITIPE